MPKKTWPLPLPFLLLALWLAGPAAATPTTLFVSSAHADPVFGPDDAHHSLWIPGLATDLDLEPGATLTVTATSWALSGVARDGDVAFDVDFVYSGLHDFASARATDPMTPKLQLAPAAYAAGGGPIDPTTWTFADTLDGTLTALPGSAFAGAVLEAELVGPMAQLGVGANGKNLHFGLSNWMVVEGWVEVEKWGSTRSVWKRFDGDVNVDAIVPEPTAALVFGAGLLLLGGRIRRGRG